MLAAESGVGSFQSFSVALTVAVLLCEFAMLRAPLSRSQVRIYAVQSLLVSGLAADVAIARHIPDLFAIVGLSLVLKVVVIPLIVLRLISEAVVDLVPSHRLGVATMVLLGLVAAGIGLFVVGAVHVHSRTLPTASFGLSASAVLVAFLLVVLRADVVSQAVGFFALENAISVASLVVAAGLPLIVEVAFFFDLLVAVVVFGVLMRVHHRRTGTLSTSALDELRG
ncbi:hypothetical protein [Aciditerrimonas ferrireducens]|uniref:hypothetical protein n=1 Tax=Aciditerrimonas ferrireducens TaxID=667306 RepID=UPI002005A945|nr:hypothetical protein [Aciditerrimonas ferrireducens]MCK4176664.1 hypothetical protein [Aciditerrimonas ferrireducens]